MRLLFLLPVIFLVFSCSNDSEQEKNLENNVNFIFEDGFETSSTDFSLLFPNDNSRWTTIQLISPNSATNSLELSSNIVSEGNQSLVIQSRQSDEILSKADIEKGGFIAPANSKVIIEADFYIDSDINIENLFLLDLECCSCWDPEVDANPSVDGDNKCPGIRLMMSGGDDYLSIERGKIAGTTLRQSSFKFPRKEWVTVRWELNLSPNEDGTNLLFINENLILSENGMNMPNAKVFRDVFAENNIDFELQEPVVYERIQVGATANPDTGDLTIYLDNFSISIEEN
ncbi:hypothetical protein MTsPCn9_13210 [Croceitalea sp. MTPC9]|uniref:hypothetical protein n=1 Tax=unclassified Croceitalea TaxID=2632280 RepID=UPI002B3DF99A|nr:hypothetical protein MTsPCn6_15920 [Croceitalea sp. MTPC6]GMN16385.1 hypothetical protein MTsPCn9_13210 [Croceitalea sp. MTPC9]